MHLTLNEHDDDLYTGFILLSENWMMV